MVNPAAESILRSPDIDFTGIAGAQLEFATAYDFATSDTVEIRIRNAATDALLGTILPLSVPNTSTWTALGPFDLSAADDAVIYLEFFYQGTNDKFLGWYIDDIVIRE